MRTITLHDGPLDHVFGFFEYLMGHGLLLLILVAFTYFAVAALYELADLFR